MLRANGTQLALVGVALLGACVSFPDVTGSAGEGGGAGGSSTVSTTSGGGGSGAASSSNTGAGGVGGGDDCVRTGPECLSTASFSTAQAQVRFEEGLLLAPQDGDAWWRDTEGTFVHVPVEGTFAAVTRVSVTTTQDDASPQDDFEVGGLLVRDPSSTKWVKFELGFIVPEGWGPKYLLGFRDADGDSQHLGNASSAYYVTASGVDVTTSWLGICRLDVAAPLVFYYAEGATPTSWTQHSAIPIAESEEPNVPEFDLEFPGAVQVGMIAGDFGDATPDARASFDTFAFVQTLPANTCPQALDAAAGQPPHCGFCAFPAP